MAIEWLILAEGANKPTGRALKLALSLVGQHARVVPPRVTFGRWQPIISIGGTSDPAWMPWAPVRVAWAFDGYERDVRGVGRHTPFDWDLVLTRSHRIAHGRWTSRLDVLRAFMRPRWWRAVLAIRKLQLRVESKSPSSRVVTVPDFNVGNPYQSLLYSAQHEFGCEVVGVRDLKAGPVDQLGPGDVLHVNWLHPLLESPSDELQAESALRVALERIDELRARGVRLVWTVHNTTSHNVQYSRVEKQFACAIADRAEVVHTFSDRAPQVLLKETGAEVSKKFIAVPHMSYLDVYVERQQAIITRLSLGIDDDAFVALCFGSMRSDSGLEVVISALDDKRLAHVHVVVAGRVAGANDVLVRELVEHPRIHLLAREIDDIEVSDVLRLANVALVPYSSGLQSGWAALAATYDLPVIASDIGCLVDDLPAAATSVFPSGDARALANAIVSWSAAQPDTLAAASQELAKWKRARSPEQISREFLTAVVMSGKDHV